MVSPAGMTGERLTFRAKNSVLMVVPYSALKLYRFALNFLDDHTPDMIYCIKMIL